MWVSKINETNIIHTQWNTGQIFDREKFSFVET
jgi:hypothetical protein